MLSAVACSKRISTDSVNTLKSSLHGVADSKQGVNEAITYVWIKKNSSEFKIKVTWIID